MSNVVRRFRLNDYWDMAEHESWYTHMAQQGLFLKKKGTFFTYFEQRPSQKMKYRIEVSKKALEDAQIDFYESAGWEYVTHYNYFHVFRSPAEINAPEIHTDPVEQANTLKDLNRMLMANWIVTIIAGMIYFGMAWAIFFLDGTPIRQLVQGATTSQLFLPIFMLLIMLQTAQAALSIRRLKKNLQSGIPLQHDIPWQKKSGRNAWHIFYLSIAIMGCVLSFSQLYVMDYGSLDEDDVRFPSVNLVAVEQDDQLTVGEDWFRGKNYHNMYSTGWNPFTKTQYTVDQTGVVPNRQWADESGVYEPSIQTEFYELRFRFLAEPLASDLMKWYGRFDLRIPSNVADGRFDKLYTREDYPKIEVAAVKGKKVVYVRYFGDAKMSDVVEQVLEFLNK